MLIKPGDVLHVTTASGSTAIMRALSSPVDGVDFPVVWACTEREYRDAVADGADLERVDGIPWPFSAIAEVIRNPDRSGEDDVLAREERLRAAGIDPEITKH